ncbi:MAG: hypothetical protein AAFP78_11990, partial [Pseudomonadota bacterium]
FYERYGANHGLHGMRRFKSIFRPEWTPRFVAAPNALALGEALLAARRLVCGDVDVAWDNPRAPRVPTSVAYSPSRPGGEVPASVASLDRERRRA